MKLLLLAITVASVALPSGASAGIIGSLRGKFDGQVAEENARQAIGSAVNLSFLSDAKLHKGKCERESKNLEFCADHILFQHCINCLAAVDKEGGKFSECRTATDYYCSETTGTAAQCAVEGVCGAGCVDDLNALVSCSLETDHCDGCSADQAANEIHSSSHFAHTMNLVAPSAVASLLAGDSEKEEPNCDEGWAALGMCISQNDEEAADACDECYAGLVTGIDWKGDLCAQLEDEAAADADWCLNAEACLGGCGKTIEATAQACETAWKDILECSGLSEEEIMGELKTDPCPGLCDENGFAIAMN